MIVNLNTLCKVQLNEFGKVIWMSQIDNIPEEIRTARPDIAENIKKSVDENGCVQCELWRIMSIFGQYMSQTSMPFVNTTLELNKNPMFGKLS